MKSTADLKDLAANLSALITQVLAGNEVILTSAATPVARIVPITRENGESKPLPPLKIRSHSRPRVVTPKITGAEIAEDIFNRE
jgi:prevent-host-death family protein